MADFGSFAKTHLLGRICQEPKTRDTKRGTKVAWFSIVTSFIFPGDKSPHPEYHRIVCYGKRAEYMMMYGNTGRLFMIEGRPHWRTWVDKEGMKHSINEVIAEQTIAVGPYKKKEDKSQKKEEAKKKEKAIDEIETYPFDEEPS